MMTKKKKPKGKSGPGKAEFVSAWLGSASVAEVAEKMDMTPANVMARASFYRKQGIELPQFRRGRRKDENARTETSLIMGRFSVIQEVLRLLEDEK